MFRSLIVVDVEKRIISDLCMKRQEAHKIADVTCRQRAQLLCLVSPSDRTERVDYLNT